MSDPNNLMCALNHLPPDLVEAILPFLPPKSLGRFKLVSKRWYSLISSPRFIKTLTLNYNKNNPDPKPTHLILFSSHGDSVYSLDVKKLNAQITPATLNAKRLNLQKSWYLGILGSCNGILLVDRVLDLRLVNPTTGKTLEFSCSSETYDDALGFGYDSSTDDYKVIIVSRMTVSDSSSDSWSHFVNVYSLRNNSWSMLPTCPYKQYDYQALRGVFFNNSLHWIVKNNRSKTMTMVTFSLANEEFHEIELPEFIKCSQDSSKHSQVFAFSGKLVVGFNGHYSPFYELWVMKEYGFPKSWTKFCVFENKIDLAFELFAQISNRDILLGISKANKLIIYNMDERRCTSVAIQACPQGSFFYNIYVESLESPERFG